MSALRPVLVVVVAALSCAGELPAAPGLPCVGEGTATCEAATNRMLQCQASAYTLYSDCRGSRGCTVSGDSAECDTSGNAVGDRCPPTSEGKVRCDPDAGRLILRCLDGGFTSIFACPAGTACGVTDAGLSCY